MSPGVAIPRKRGLAGMLPGGMRSTPPPKKSASPKLSSSSSPVRAVERVRVRAPQCELPRLAVLDAQVLPVEQWAEPLDAVALVDTLPPRLLRERKHVVRELSDRILDGLHRLSIM